LAEFQLFSRLTALRPVIECQRKPRDARRPFVTASYRLRADGRLRPEIPGEGPCRDGEVPCRVGSHHRRSRVTGPGFPILVVKCWAHDKAFTLYPSGYYPYGRRKIAPVAPDGADLRKDGEGIGALSETLFAAAVDAAQGVAWPRESGGLEEYCWPSMCRRLSTAVLWLNLTPEPDDEVAAQIARRVREERAADLDVDLLLLKEGAAAILAAPGYRSRGTAVVQVLGELPAGRPLLERLLRAGHAAGASRRVARPGWGRRNGRRPQPGGEERAWTCRTARGACFSATMHRSRGNILRLHGSPRPVSLGARRRPETDSLDRSQALCQPPRLCRGSDSSRTTDRSAPWYEWS
jgi:hypothetical protein